MQALGMSLLECMFDKVIIECCVGVWIENTGCFQSMVYSGSMFNMSVFLD